MWENVLAVIPLKSGTQGLTVSKYQSVNEDFFFICLLENYVYEMVAMVKILVANFHTFFDVLKLTLWCTCK